MNILVFNCGSSSLNYKIFKASRGDELKVVCKGKAHRVGLKGSQPSFIEHYWQGERLEKIIPIPDHASATRLIFEFLQEKWMAVNVIGHRFVHSGKLFQSSTILTPENLPGLETCLPLAPIHNPASMSVIRVCGNFMPDAPQYVTFDTAFHAGMEAAAYTYALPQDLYLAKGWRKYGFHGLSYQYVTQKASEYLHRPLDELKLIACHLGTGGSSVAAFAQGRSVDTSMGFSPLTGLMMSTRSGDIDPSLPLYWAENDGHSPDEIEDLLNKKSGLLGVSGLSSDIRDLQAAGAENPAASRAVELYTYRLRKTIGAFSALLRGFEALIFTDDIGVQNPEVRRLACEGLAWCGVELNSEANGAAPRDQIAEISAAGSAVRILSIPTDEEAVIGREGLRLFPVA
ncbi:MAG: acetate/propionate family kinase [Anaerolineaceae bacterium]